MSVVHFIVGVAALAVGLLVLFGREAIVARQQRRSGSTLIQAPMMYLVLGGLLALVGLLQVILAVD